MWVRLYPSQFQFILLSAFVLAPMFSAPETFAQEGEAGTVVEKSARERELRDKVSRADERGDVGLHAVFGRMSQPRLEQDRGDEERR